MKKKLLTAVAFVVGIGLQAQVGINTATPRATLDVQPTAQALQNGENVGVIFPQLTSEQIRNISNPTIGTAVYNTTLNCLMVYNGNSVTAGTDVIYNWECEAAGKPLHAAARLRAYGGSDLDFAYDVIQTSDRGYLFTGISDSNDGDLAGIGKGGWIVKIDEDGKVLWKHSVPQSNFYKVVEQNDGTLFAVGFDHSGTYHIGKIVKLSRKGEILEQRNYGGSYHDRLTSAITTADGGLIVSGFTASTDGDLASIKTNNKSDYWIFKIKPDLSIDAELNKVYGSDGSSIATDIIDDGDGYIVAGVTDNDGGDVNVAAGTHHGKNDFWIIKIDRTGEFVWQRLLGGSENEGLLNLLYPLRPYLIRADDGVLVGGGTNSTDGDIAESHGSYDAWICKLDQNGNYKWQNSFGTSEIELSFAGKRTQSGDFLITVTSLDSNNSKIHRIKNDGTVVSEKNLPMLLPMSMSATNDGRFVVAGLDDLGLGGGDALIIFLDQNGNEVNP